MPALAASSAMSHVRVMMSRNGRFVALRQGPELLAVDALGPAPRRTFAMAEADNCVIVNQTLWLSRRGRLQRAPLVGDVAIADVAIDDAVNLVACNPSVLVETARDRVLVEAAGTSREPRRGDRVLCAVGRRMIAVRDDRVVLRTFGRDDVAALPVRGCDVQDAAFLFEGRTIVMWTRGSDADALVVCTANGKVVHRIATPALTACAFAEDAGLAVVVADSHVRAYDLRYGQLRGSFPCTDEPLAALAIDALGRRVAIARPDSLEVSVLAVDDLFRERVPATPVAVDEVDEPEPEHDDEEHIEAAAGPTLSADDVALAELRPLALVPRAKPVLATMATDAPAFRDAEEHLEALLDVVAARAALAIAEGWHSGRTSHDIAGLPFEREVLGLLGEDVGLAADAVRAARARLAMRAAELTKRTYTTLASGIDLPFIDVAREYDLSPIATQILATVVAPRLRASIARLYGVLAGLPGRTACIEHLLEVLVEAPTPQALGSLLAAELAPDAPLLRAGLVSQQHYAERTLLVVDDVLADRLRGMERKVEISTAMKRRVLGPALSDVVAPAPVKRALQYALADHDSYQPARVVVRGKTGSGRHTLIAALAAIVGRTIAELDVTRLPRGEKLAPSLALELARAQFAKAVPVVSGLESIERTDADVRRAVQDVLRRHGGPVVLRTAPDADLPIEPGRIDVTLPPLSIAERTAVWHRALARHGLVVDGPTREALAIRFRFGPGTIERVAEQAARRARRDPAPVAQHVDECARHHISGRLERVATRITRLADWDQVTLLDEMRDSVRELIGRMQCQRTVYEDWGYDRRIATARGLTALFYGPPGTGKTLVAGLIGRELGLDVWRIDLARVMSKWIGETEKSLAEVFEAAEEGQVLLLFDEADSLFGKRSEVKSSNDRYANLEVNYLLQRLDSFEGVAILTTNLEGSIDPAFKRRLSMRLYFPFPDEELRAELWAAHVPPNVPCAGNLDFADLARRYPLSGGYIRNSALRAAFLAAQERRPLSQDHLLRAVQLEYRELGKLSTSGRMD